ncbi:ChuX/HutX family heme-like substrate-binding protein [Geminicoccaceae bacterium 1502E]|nr:ChuX/HutX family heme-like substrate-binding protein [Geminicoccaceae bacterium 1502E]
METSVAQRDPAALLAAANRLREAEGLRARDLAGRLGVSEGELLAAEVGAGGGGRVVRLVDDATAILREVPRLGEVMALTRNEAAVHEKTGTYGKVELESGHGGVFEQPIDLRLFMSHWRSGFAVEQPGPEGAMRRSLQFFDAHGTAVHKVHLGPQSRVEVFEELVARFAEPAQPPGLAVTPRPARKADRPDEAVDREALVRRWQAMTDVHQFFGLLRELEVGREQAFRLAGSRLAFPVARGSFALAGEMAAAGGVSIMIFVANMGCTQIHTGPVGTIKAMGPWWNILDPGFNLHLRQDLVARAWVVRKPMAGHMVTSLEIFDEQARLIAIMYGERPRGEPEQPAWRALLDRLPRLDAPA